MKSLCLFCVHKCHSFTCNRIGFSTCESASIPAPLIPRRATFVKKLENNRELWVIEGYVNGNAQFCLHYTTDNGVDAWDNNDGKDYRFYDVAEYDNREIKELLK